MKNAEWLLKRGMEFSKLKWGRVNGRNNVYYDMGSCYKEIYSEKSINPENLITKWLDMEYVEPVLDEVERQYLGAIIKPFRKKVVFIRKDMGPGIYAQIIIRVRSAGSVADIEFPFFKGKRMYRGMKVYKEYTIEELGL